MSDTLITIIAIFAVAILMFVFPLMATTGQNDEITESSVKAIVEEFVNTVASKGKVTNGDYNSFLQDLEATGNTFEVELEAQILDDNPGVKGSSTSSVNVVGENIYYSEYTTAILNSVNTEGQYMLSKGDYFIASVENTNITLGKQLKTFFYKVIGKDTSTIKTSASALVAITGVK